MRPETINLSLPLSEDELIARLFAPIAGPGALALKDDAALVRPRAGHDVVATVDAIVAGVHFFPDDAPESVARKALRVNLSDLAAKGAEPMGFLLTLALPADMSGDWLGRFASALGADARDFRIELLGGDTVRTPGPLTISITAMGQTPEGRMVPRTGARAGDWLYVSGTIGDAAIGLRLRLDPEFAGRLPPDARRELAARYLEPRPRNALAPAMRLCANGGMDISDGFAGDIAKMLRASGVSARIGLSAMPLSAAALAAIDLDPALFETAATGGDDFELLASVPPARADEFEAMALAAGVPVTRVGEVIAGAAPPEFIGPDGALRTFARASFSHF